MTERDEERTWRKRSEGLMDGNGKEPVRSQNGGFIRWCSNECSRTLSLFQGIVFYGVKSKSIEMYVEQLKSIYARENWRKILGQK